MARYKVKREANGGWSVSAPFGVFHCPDFAGLAQMDYRWEVEVREIIGNLEGRLFLDVGANIGFYSVMAAKNRNHVIAIEPSKKAFGCLIENVTVNKLDHLIEPYNLVAWNMDGEVPFREGRHTDISSVSHLGEYMRATTLDTILDGRVPSLVKIDVEGSEYEVLSGAMEMLEAKPQIVFEALTYEKLEDCTRLLGAYGYSIKRLDRTNFHAA